VSVRVALEDTAAGGADAASAQHLMRLDVVDHGPGLSEEQRESIFLPQERASVRHPPAAMGCALRHHN
jgi:hypothetical protein